MVDQTKWGIADIQTQNKARALEKQKLKDKVKDLENEIDRLAEENANILVLNKTLKKENTDLTKKLEDQVKEFRNKGDL